MSPDDIDSLVLDLHDFLRYDLDIAINDTSQYSSLSDFMHNALEKFVTRDRNYN